MICNNCWSKEIYKETGFGHELDKQVGYGQTKVYRCWGCGKCGTKEDFKDL